MDNRELIKDYLSKFDGKYNEEETPYGFWDVQCIMDLARQDEREKMTEEKIAEHFAKLSTGEVAATMLTYLLRGGITDDDLRGLRLQWIPDEREEMQGVEIWVSWNKGDYRPFISEYEDLPQGKRDVISCWASESIFKVTEGQCRKFKLVECGNE